MRPKDALRTGLLALGWLSSLAASQESTATFLFPPMTTAATGSNSQLVINVLDTVIVEYTSNFKDAWLWIWCDSGSAGPSLSRWYEKQAPVNGTVAYSPFSETDINRPWDKAYTCHIDLNYENKDLKNINGPWFSVTSVASLQAKTFMREATSTNRSPSSSPSVSTLPTSSSATSSSATSSSATSSSATSSSATLSASSGTASTPSVSNTSSPPSAPSNSGLSTGATAGIAVGVFAGVSALLGLGFLAWRNKRKVNKLKSRLPDDSTGHYSKPHGVEVAQPYHDDVACSAYAPSATKYAMEADQRHYVHRTGPPPPVELDPLHPPQELPASGVEGRRP